MANHHKPTKEELKANMDKSLEQLENLPDPAPEAEPETPPATPPTPPEESPVEPENPEAEPETPPATPPTPPTEEEPKPDDIDWKKKYSASAREAQLQAYKNKEIAKAMADAAALAEPSEEDLKKEYSEWEDMTDTEKRLAKESVLNKRRFELINEATSKFSKVDDWNEKITTFITDPKVLIAHPELEGKEEEFKHFASIESRRGVDFETLVLAFSGETAKNAPPPKKGQMFEQGSGGPTPPAPKDDRLSPAEGAALAKSNYKEFVKKLKAGKIRQE